MHTRQLRIPTFDALQDVGSNRNVIHTPLTSSNTTRHNKCGCSIRREGQGGTDGQLIWTLLPADYGRQAHADRRRAELEEHLDFIGRTTDDLLWAFDYWLEYSRPLRQYLWAYSSEDEQRARTIIEVLGVERVKTVLRWLAEAYWDRYVGWPDLLTWRETLDGPRDVLFVEVKSSSDKLSDDQKTWIGGNRETLGFDFELVKVHRAEKVLWLTSEILD